MRRNPIYLALFPVSLALMAAGCGTSEPAELPQPDLLVRTDKPSYSLAMDHAARPTLINQGSFPIYAPMNQYVYVEQWSDNGWVNRIAWFAVDGSSSSFPVAPGDSLTAPEMSLRYVNNRAGFYRFVFEVALDPYGRMLVPEEERASEPFEVTWE